MARNALVLNYGKMNNKFTLCTIYKRYLGYVLIEEAAAEKNCNEKGDRWDDTINCKNIHYRKP